MYLDAGRENQKNAKKDLEKTEEDLKALQSVGQIIGEVLRPLDKERCKWKNVFNVWAEYFFCRNNERIWIIYLTFSYISLHMNFFQSC